MSDLELQKASMQFQADEHAAASAAAARVADFQASTTPAPAPAAPLTPEQQAADEQKAQAAKALAFAQAMLPKVCVMVWAIADRAIQSAGGKELAITDAERAQLAEATGPVVDKYVADSLKWIFTTPEGALAFTALVIYGPKLMAMQSSASSPAAPTPPASVPAVPVVTAEAAHA